MTDNNGIQYGFEQGEKGTALHRFLRTLENGDVDRVSFILRLPYEIRIEIERIILEGPHLTSAASLQPLEYDIITRQADDAEESAAMQFHEAGPDGVTHELVAVLIPREWLGPEAYVLFSDEQWHQDGPPEWPGLPLSSSLLRQLLIGKPIELA